MFARFMTNYGTRCTLRILDMYQNLTAALIRHRPLFRIILPKLQLHQLWLTAVEVQLYSVVPGLGQKYLNRGGPL